MMIFFKIFKIFQVFLSKMLKKHGFPSQISTIVDLGKISFSFEAKIMDFVESSPTI